MTKLIQKDVFDVIRSAVNKTVDFIKPTFGPSSNKVIISKPHYGWNTLIVDDGVQIARDLEFDDPAENTVLKVVRETAIKTNDRVGDGTTGALIMLQAIIEEMSKINKRDNRSIEKELRIAFEEVKKQLLDTAKPIKTKEELFQVALISFDNEKIARMIADAWFQLGVNGILTIDRSSTMETFIELIDGITINRGYISPYMITDPQKMECVMEKPYILFTDYRLTEVTDIMPILEKMSKGGVQNLVVIADNVEGSALATMVVNLPQVYNMQLKRNGNIPSIAINAPTGDNRISLLEDMAIMTGGKVFSEKKGDKIQNAEIADLGRAERFISRRTESVIVGPKGNKDNIDKSIIDLEKAINQESDIKIKSELNKRLARFSNKIGIIKVGAPTENELTQIKYKVDDAVNSTHVAFKSGVVCGAGLALANIQTSSSILNESLKAPYRQLMNNVGMNIQNIEKDEAINVVTGEKGNWQKIGVMDPVDVLIAQVDSAVSIASLLITTSGILVEKPKPMKQEEE